MILINLLPHREARRQQRKQAFFAGLGFAAIVGGFIAGIWFTAVGTQISEQEQRNAFLGSEIKRLEGQIKDIATLQEEIAALRARQQAVEDLQADRNMPVYLLNELVKETPEGVYLTSVRQNGQQVAVTGLAQTNERISEFLRNASYNSTWLERPALGSIQATSATTAGSKESRRMFEFAMTVTLKRPPAPGATPASAASAPAPASTAAASQPAAKG